MTSTHRPAEDAENHDSSSPAGAGADATEPEDHLVVTAHSIALPDGPLAYTATTGTVVLREEPDGDTYGRGSAYAEMFSVSYVAASVEDTAARPVVFAFNGGPGASTVWLHLGQLGPRRVDAPEPMSRPGRRTVCWTITTPCCAPPTW